jgi:DNA-binding response OmpR family regulator
MAHRTHSVCVVDARAEDYSDWDFVARQTGVRLHFVADASQALRLARTQSVDLWVINTQLADLSGFELCGLIKGQASRGSVYLVSDHYSADEERAAWQARADVFGCKGAHDGWLAQWITRRCQRTSGLLAAAAASCNPTI